MIASWITANGISLRYELAGNGTSVVLLHEMGGTLDSWDGVAPGLVRRFRVLRFDQRGAGLSEKPRPQFTNELLVDDLDRLISAIDLAVPYHVVAVAAACVQAISYYRRYPSRVGSLIFCNPALGPDAMRAGQLEERALKAERDGIRAVLNVTLEKSYPPELTDRATYDAYRARYLANDPLSFAHMHRVVARNTVTQFLPSIACPVLIVSGRQDTVRPSAATEAYARQIPNARFELLDGGHFLPVTSPKGLLQLINEFLPQP